MSEVTAAVIRDGYVIDHVAFDVGIPPDGKSVFTWIEVFDPTDRDFALLQERFGLHSLAVEDSMRPEQIPKVDLYEDQIFVVLKIARLEDDAIVYGEIDAFVSADHIVTICHSAGGGHSHARERFQSGPKLTQAQPDFVLHGILDYVVNGYFPIVQMIEDEVLAMEQHLHDALLDRKEITRLFQLRRETIHFKHTLARMSDVCGRLASLDVPSIGAESRPYFRVMHEHLTRLDAMVSGLIEVIRSVFETSTLLELQRQGIITRQLAAWAAILGVPAAVAGIYGTTAPNVTEFRGPLGYAVVIGVILALCLALYVRFRKLNWL
jgi:magnesium transporter